MNPLRSRAPWQTSAESFAQVGYIWLTHGSREEEAEGKVTLGLARHGGGPLGAPACLKGANQLAERSRQTPTGPH
jgi:hypothetical protein